MFTFLLLTIAAEPVPTFKVENKVPPFVVVNKITTPGDPYGYSTYDDFYRAISSGIKGVLVVGIEDRYVQSYTAHCRVASGFGGLADGEYDCYPRYGNPLIVPRPKASNAAPAVAAASTFRGQSAGYNASHNCPQCGRAQYVVGGRGPVPGSHTHTCSAGHTWWH